MKKLFYYLVLLLPLSICGCSEDLDYRNAVRKQDFQKAHMILDKLQEKMDDWYENNELVEENVFTGSDYSNYHKFEKMCQNQVDAISFVYGEEMKYLAEQDGESSRTKINFLGQELVAKSNIVINKLRAHSSSSANELAEHLNSHLNLLENSIKTICPDL